MTCTRCGDQDEPYRKGLCARCCLTSDLNALLTPPDSDAVANELRPLLDALTGQDNPRSAIIWLRNPDVLDLLTGITAGRYPITHVTFADHASPRAARHLRDLLVKCGILTPYDRNLDRFTSWIDTKLATTPILQAHDVIARFATWNHLRKLRTRAEQGPLSEGPILNAKQEITVAIDFVNWLQRNGIELASTTQADIDHWITTGPSTRSTAMMFVKWCIRHQHLPADLVFPRRQVRQSPITDDRQRYARLAETLRRPDTPTWVKAATVLLLICAQPVTRIAAIRLEAITHSDNGVINIEFGETPVKIPTTLAAPITELLRRRPHMKTAANQTSAWLFPGRTPGQHVNPQALMKHLRANGIELRGARNSAMRELLRDIPPAIVADQFGFHPGTTERHALGTGTGWSAYPTLHGNQEDTP
ncbi:hypothetical protein NWF34_11015 [Gordonia sp. GONU]|uniref:hypothetical protein n=1 Tax=Gordonia sp. GONU TaxID=2972949 RepID=UPI0021AC7BDD|nr:hypothetical protein [Gordonia sp. GONU]MCR8897477.1 hypothetical protein [Gordonia sp. GONU]